MKRVSVSLLRETIVAYHELGPLPQSLSAEQCPGRLLFTALAFYRPLRMSCRPTPPLLQIVPCNVRECVMFFLYPLSLSKRLHALNLPGTGLAPPGLNPSKSAMLSLSSLTPSSPAPRCARRGHGWLLLRRLRRFAPTSAAQPTPPLAPTSLDYTLNSFSTRV